MDCPYDAIALNPKRLESEVDVEICPICGGIWLSENEIAALQTAHARDRHDDEDDLEPVRAAYEMAADEQQAPGPCPICGDPLVHKEYAYTSQVVVDTCPNGHGLWLNRGELERLERFFVRQHGAQPVTGGLRELWRQVVLGLWGPTES